MNSNWSVNTKITRYEMIGDQFLKITALFVENPEKKTTKTRIKKKFTMKKRKMSDDILPVPKNKGMTIYIEKEEKAKGTKETDLVLMDELKLHHSDIDSLIKQDNKEALLDLALH
jgi:hypothetical protein